MRGKPVSAHMYDGSYPQDYRNGGRWAHVARISKAAALRLCADVTGVRQEWMLNKAFRVFGGGEERMNAEETRDWRAHNGALSKGEQTFEDGMLAVYNHDGTYWILQWVADKEDK